MIDTILSVGKTLFSLKGKLESSRRNRRDRIANYFEAISTCLTEVSGKLKANEVPHGKCAELATYAKQLPATIGDEIGSAEAERLGRDLGSAHEVELLLAELGKSPDKSAELAKLDDASGVFMALANSIRAAP